MPYIPQAWANEAAGGTPVSAERLNVMEAGIDLAHTVADAALPSATAISTYVPFTFARAYTTPYAAVEPVQNIQITTKNSGPVTQRRMAYRAQVTDHAGVNQVTVTGATNATPIVITAVAHGYATGDRVTVQGVTGNTAANGIWVITVLSADTFSLTGSVGNGAFVAGGYVTNRSMMTGFHVDLGVNVQRGGLTGAAANGDDADGFTVINSGNARATDAFYVADSPAIAGDAWVGAYVHDGKAAVGFRAGGTYSVAAAELCGSLLLGAAAGAFGAGDVRLQRTGTKQLTFDDGAGGNVDIKFVNATAASATAGTNGAPPAQVTGYLTMRNQFSQIKIPYYSM